MLAVEAGCAKMVLRILCGIGDQEHSWRATSVGIDLAKRLSAELILCMINPAVLPSPRGARVYQWTESYVQEVLNENLSRARALGLWDVRGETRRAKTVTDGILACAHHYEADYIIVGATCRSSFMQVFSGSVWREVSMKANCPVLIVRDVRSPSGKYYGDILKRLMNHLTSLFNRIMF